MLTLIDKQNHPVLVMRDRAHPLANWNLLAWSMVLLEGAAPDQVGIMSCGVTR